MAEMKRTIPKPLALPALAYLLMVPCLGQGIQVDRIQPKSVTTIEDSSVLPGPHGAYAQGNTWGPINYVQYCRTNNANNLASQYATSTFGAIILSKTQTDPVGTGALNIPQFCMPILWSALRHDPASTGYMIGISGIITDDTKSGVYGKGSLVGIEDDLNNSSTADYSAFDDKGSIPGSDWYGNGALITSVGSNKGGIGLFIKANVTGLNPGCTTIASCAWQRGEVIRDWNVAGLHIINDGPNPSSGHNIVLEGSLSGTAAADIAFSDGGNPSAICNLKWIAGKNSAQDFNIFDNTNCRAGINRFTLFHSSSGNADSRLSAEGAGTTRINFDGGTGGVAFGDGVGNTKATVNSSGLGTFTGVSASGAGLITLGSTTVHALPSAASNPGAMIMVIDSTVVAGEGQTCAGGSSNKAIAISNGTTWKCF